MRLLAKLCPRSRKKIESSQHGVFWNWSFRKYATWVSSPILNWGIFWVEFICWSANPFSKLGLAGSYRDYQVKKRS